MSHLSHRAGYAELFADRLNRAPQGAPPSESLYKILAILFSEREAGLLALLPIRLFTAAKAAAIWKMGRSSGPKHPGGSGWAGHAGRYRG